MRTPSPLLLALATALAACESSSTESIACPAIVKPALVLRVLDRDTGAPLATGTTAIATEGAWSQPFRGPFGTVTDTLSYPFSAADERPGTYVVEVRTPGYATLTIRNVTARRGQCGVNTVQVTARLSRAAN